MKKSEQKKSLVEDLSKYHKALNVKQLYEESDHKTSKDWLAEVAAILKNLDETDFRAFLDLRQHLYPSIPLVTRKHAAEQIDGFIRQKVAEYKRYDFEAQEQSTVYINQEIIEGFIKKQDSFNYKKLIRLLGELNANYAAGYPYSSSMLVRAILDHIPPLLGCNSFEEVVSNYTWSRTDKEYMSRLLDFKNDADDALHRQISKDQDLLEMENLPNSNRINRLLQECLKVGGTVKPSAFSTSRQPVRPKNIQVKLTEEKISWANYGVARYVWSSFRVSLEIDNFKSNKPDYISVLIRADLKDGSSLIGDHFIFERVDKQDEDFRIEANEVKKVTVFVSDYRADNQTRKPMPEVKTLKIEVLTRSGERFIIPLEESQIIKG